MPSCSVLDNSNTDPDRRNIRVRSTTGGFNHEGLPLYYNIFGMVMPSTFTDDAAGQQAMNTANGTDSDGTPIITQAIEVDDLEKKGFAEEQTRALDGSQVRYRDAISGD